MLDNSRLPAQTSSASSLSGHIKAATCQTRPQPPGPLARDSMAAALSHGGGETVEQPTCDKPQVAHLPLCLLALIVPYSCLVGNSISLTQGHIQVTIRDNVLHSVYPNVFFIVKISNYSKPRPVCLLRRLHQQCNYHCTMHMEIKSCYCSVGGKAGTDVGRPDTSDVACCST